MTMKTSCVSRGSIRDQHVSPPAVTKPVAGVAPAGTAGATLRCNNMGLHPEVLLGGVVRCVARRWTPLASGGTCKNRK